MRRLAASLAAVLLAATTGALALAPAASASSQKMVNVRAAHLVPGLGAMDIGVIPGDVKNPGALSSSEITARKGVGYGDVTPYHQLPEGTYTVTVRQPGQDGAAPVLSGVLNISADHSYTIAALGTTQDAGLRALVDNPSGSVPSGQAEVRLINAVDGQNPVSVTAQDGPTLVNDLAFAVPTGYATVPARQWNLNVDPGTPASVDLGSGSSYTILLLTSNGQTVAKPIVDAAGSEFVPTGRIDAGFGGTADQGPSLLGVGAFLAAFAVLSTGGGLVLVRLRRR